MYRLAENTKIVLSDVIENNWLVDCTPDWIDKAYPDNLVDLLSTDANLVDANLVDENVAEESEFECDSDFSSGEDWHLNIYFFAHLLKKLILYINQWRSLLKLDPCLKIIQ
jgi:hypothetical protein